MIYTILDKNTSPQGLNGGKNVWTAQSLGGNALMI